MALSCQIGDDQRYTGKTDRLLLINSTGFIAPVPARDLEQFFNLPGYDCSLNYSRDDILSESFCKLIAANVCRIGGGVCVRACVILNVSK